MSSFPEPITFAGRVLLSVLGCVMIAIALAPYLIEFLGFSFLCLCGEGGPDDD